MNDESSEIGGVSTQFFRCALTVHNRKNHTQAYTIGLTCSGDTLGTSHNAGTALYYAAPGHSTFSSIGMMANAPEPDAPTCHVSKATRRDLDPGDAGVTPQPSPTGALAEALTSQTSQRPSPPTDTPTDNSSVGSPTGDNAPSPNPTDDPNSDVAAPMQTPDGKSFTAVVLNQGSVPHGYRITYSYNAYTDVTGTYHAAFKITVTVPRADPGREVDAPTFNAGDGPGTPDGGQGTWHWHAAILPPK
ncbi:hypothetical protein [Streptomyces gibsoniae]|uniref:Uncharacterized protein n=1 Tax=Streptomyces gibsoniae TaxID=3075529 RepID=A0ABU2U0A6_9ACTN|nr:hypothetical protein [Streptomyces sp. DSM 41699]MDT0466652.1 hypothetical protein [Streptomyces sp. DSM 41699]